MAFGAVAAAAVIIPLIPTTIVIEVKHVPIQAPIIEKVVELTIPEMIVETARIHAIDEKKFLEVAKCESSLNPKAIGDSGKSVGLFQIHLPSHPDVSMEEALDPSTAIAWSAAKFKDDPTIWTCYNRLYERPNP